MTIRVEPAPNPVVAVGAVRFGNALPLALIAGPCALESRAHALEMAAALKEITGRLGICACLQNVVRQSEPHQRRKRARHRPQGGAANPRRCAIDLRHSSADRRARTRSMRAGRRSSRCAADPGLPVPADRSARRRRAHRARHQRQERPVPGALGHGQCGGQNHRRRKRQRARHRTRRVIRLQHAGVRHARACRSCVRPARR